MRFLLFLSGGLVFATAHVYGVSCDGWNTPLFFMRATPEVVIGCLESGANPMARGNYGGTALHRAAVQTKYPAVLTALVEAGADIEARNDFGATPLQRAGLTQLRT